MRQVLVGRNNMENDKLSHVVAASSDLWFHARGFPGSHTVLRIPAGRCGRIDIDPLSTLILLPAEHPCA